MRKWLRSVLRDLLHLVAPVAYCPNCSEQVRFDRLGCEVCCPACRTEFEVR